MALMRIASLAAFVALVVAFGATASADPPPVTL